MPPARRLGASKGVLIGEQEHVMPRFLQRMAERRNRARIAFRSIRQGHQPHDASPYYDQWGGSDR